jgi:hypothetical protein
MDQTSEPRLTLAQKFLRILNNLLYILGEFYGKTLKETPQLMALIESFIEGWIDGKSADVST